MKIFKFSYKSGKASDSVATHLWQQKQKLTSEQAKADLGNKSINNLTIYELFI